MHLRILCAICAALVFLGCSSSNSKILSRSSAADFVKTSERFKNDPLTVTLNREAGLFGAPNTNSDVNEPTWKKMQDAGYAKLTYNNFMHTDITWTPKGETLKAQQKDSWKKCQFGADCWIVPLGHRAFVDVTGITQEENSTDAVAEFTWNWNLGDFAKQLKLGDTLIHKGAAAFKRYDDGWRVQKVVLEGDSPF